MRSMKKRRGLKKDQRRIYYGDGASSLGWRPFCFLALRRVVVYGVRRLLGRQGVPTPRIDVGG